MQFEENIRIRLIEPMLGLRETVTHVQKQFNLTGTYFS